MKVHIPNSAFIGNIDSFIRNLDLSDDSNLSVTSNPEWISIHPIVVSMIVALAKDVLSKNGSITCQEFTAKSKSYLLRMGVIESLNPNHGILVDEHEPAGRFIPARQIFTSEQLNDFITEMIPLLHTTPEQAYPIKYVMSELVYNVLEHSDSEIGAVISAQYFKKTNRISIGVADRGMGIRKSINKSYAARNDMEAIGLSLMPGVTGTTKRIGGTEFNAGAGLFFTKSIAKVSKDFFLIYSGDSFYKLLKTHRDKRVRLEVIPEEDRHNFQTNLPKWDGTAIGIDISMDINQDFEELLELIRDAYQLKVKSANKVKYKKPKFL